LIERVFRALGWLKDRDDHSVFWYSPDKCSIVTDAELDDCLRLPRQIVYVAALCEAAEMLLDDARATERMNTESDAILFRLAEEDRSQAARILRRAGIAIEEWEKTR
jgi:uncharacterized protein (DUF58 family)